MSHQLEFLAKTMLLAKEYKQLSLLAEPTDNEIKRLLEILEQCTFNEMLSELVHEISSDTDEVFRYYEEIDSHKAEEFQKQFKIHQ
jgi:hypothetical protein